jgi:dTDP-4-amino-4,6-dideoxygalactose transaminase
MRDTFLPFALPDTDQAELDEIAEAVRSGWVTTGPKTRQFEAEFAAAVGAGHAIAVNSCTAAMHLALEAVGLGPGDLVLTTPYTFAATAEVARYFDALPIFVDVEPDTLNIDPLLLAEAAQDLSQGGRAARRWLPTGFKCGAWSVERGAANGRWQAANGRNGRQQAADGNEQITRLKVILPVHIAGLPAELDAIETVAARHKLAVVEDAAHAFPARYRDCTIGGDPGDSLLRPAYAVTRATCFSFYATKTITTGEGGMICTGDAALAERCRVMALHGISKDAWKRYSAQGAWYYEITAPGFKYNMTDIAAAMGLAQLRKAERMWRRRCEIAGAYNAAFSNLPELLQVPADRADCQHAWHLYILRLNLARLSISRDQFIQALKARNIGASVHFIPLHLHPYYRETYGYAPEDFPVACREYRRALSLPIYSRMSDRDVEDVIQAVLALAAEYRTERMFLSVGINGPHHTHFRTKHTGL